ncbi:phosphoribosyltransferase family protein [Paenibacillus thiaminolyticus]|nr:phosphoribosyltransferase family protein [Paenibacillus thiaminolyticus]WCF08366.1 phosphoribosyltransferase family protein [Paenibacillus thiaminolyticus]
MHLFNILGDLQVTIEITRNPFNLPPDTLFRMAARINKKRSFLFVSKILGKHLAVNPNVSLLSGAALGVLYQEHVGGLIPYSIEEIIRAFEDPEVASDIYNKVKSNPLPIVEPTLFLGFAETATALGHSMFDIFLGPTKFLHTTRDRVMDLNPAICFEEEHSHATDHRCYALDQQFLCGKDSVVLVDDEITTGKTALNIIRELQHKHPRSNYVVASLLDWRSDNDIQLFNEVERELGITITCLSLLQGRIMVTGGPVGEKHTALPLSLPAHASQLEQYFVGNFFDLLPLQSENSLEEQNRLPYLEWTGRFGMRGQDTVKLDCQLQRCSEFLQSKRRGTRTLCMGSGEFMYIPMRIAAGMGEGVLYQSSTRSPIHPHDGAEYAIYHAFPYASPDDASVTNFFYNVTGNVYDEIFVFVERTTDTKQLASLIEALKRTSVPLIHIVHFTKYE